MTTQKIDRRSALRALLSPAALFAADALFTADRSSAAAVGPNDKVKVTKVEYSDRFDEGQLTIEFHVKLRTYTDFDDANPNSPNDLAYIVVVARTTAGWKVVSVDLPGAS